MLHMHCLSDCCHRARAAWIDRQHAPPIERRLRVYLHMGQSTPQCDLGAIAKSRFYSAPTPRVLRRREYELLSLFRELQGTVGFGLRPCPMIAAHSTRTRCAGVRALRVG